MKHLFSRLKYALLFMLCMVSTACGALRSKAPVAVATPLPGETAYLIDGDFDTAKKLLAEELDKAPCATAAFLLGDLLDAEGRPEEALEKYFEALALAHKSDDAPDAAIAAATAVTAIRDRVERFLDKLNRFMSEIGDSPGELPPEAWFQLLNLRFGLLRMQGETQAAKAQLTRLGCVTRWKSVGPVGPWTWAAFDDEGHPADGPVPPEKIDLGPSRGITVPRDIEENSCFVAADNPNVPLGGVTWMRTRVTLKRPSTVYMRLQTSFAASVRVNGREVLRRDPREAYLSKVLWAKINLSTQKADVTVKLAGVNGAPSFSLALFDETGAPAFSSALPAATETLAEKTVRAEPLDNIETPNELDTLTPARLYAKMKCALWRDDIERARTLYLHLLKDRETPSPILQQTFAELIGADPSLPFDLAYERARPYLKRALEAEPRLWQARIGLADRELDEERVLEALGLLQEGREINPEEVSVPRRQASAFFGRGWIAEAEAAVSRIEQLLPSACSTLDWKLAAARRRGRFDLARQIAEQSVKCNVFSTYLLEELRRANDVDEAADEAKRLFALSPKSAAAALEIAEAAAAADNIEQSIAALEKTLALSPFHPGVATALSDALKMKGDDNGAKEILDNALSNTFAAKIPLSESRAALDEAILLRSYREDGPSVIEQYKEEPPDYDAAAVYVLDRAVYLTDKAGGLVMLVHSITHLKTDEAVESHGELSIPNDATLLLARTIKADGRRLEPEAVQGKDTLSMPELEPGDFVEYEYIKSMYPSQLFPGGFDTGRFYFQDFETGFHRTEVILVCPADMRIQTDPRGNCPEPEEERDGEFRVITWKTQNASPYPSEPLSPSAVELLPSIRITAFASWENIFKQINEQLADKDQIGHIIRDTVRDVLKGIAPSNHRARRKAIYRWVTRHIEPSQNMFEKASHIIARKSGSRARSFVAMLRAAGYSPRLALVMPSGEDETPSAEPSLNRFYLPLVYVPDDGFIELGNESAPYGFLPAVLRNRPLRFADTGERSKTDGGARPRDEQHVVVSLKISAKGDAIGRIRETFTGSLAVNWRSALEKNKKADRRRLFQSAYLSEALPGASLIRLDIEGLKNPDRPLCFEYDVAVSGFASADGENSLYIKLPYETNFGKQSGGLPSRITPLTLSLHATKTVETTLDIPTGMRFVEDKDAEQSADRSWGHASRGIRITGNKAVAKFETTVDIDRIEPEEYEAFLAFAKKVDRASNISLRFTGP